MDVVGVIPCAGKGERLGLPFSKELYPDFHCYDYQPILKNTIDAMKLVGVKHIIFTINHEKEDIIKYLGNGDQFNLNFSYCIHPQPKSLPESINEAHHLLKDHMVLFAMPDTFVRPKNYLLQMVHSHLSDSSVDMTLGCFKTKYASKFGMVNFDEKGIVLDIVDKPIKTNLVWMWGAMVWNPTFTNQLKQYVNKKSIDHDDSELILSDACKTLIAHKKVKVYCFEEGIYKDLGTYDELDEWKKYWQEKEG